MAILLLFFVPPIVAALILAAMLHVPFRWFREASRGLKIYLWVRVVLALVGFGGVLAFRLSGGDADPVSSEFSPIGTDERGLVIFWAQITAVAFGVISAVELTWVMGNRVLYAPDGKPSGPVTDDEPH